MSKLSIKEWIFTEYFQATFSFVVGLITISCMQFVGSFTSGFTWISFSFVCGSLSSIYGFYVALVFVPFITCSNECPKGF
jgi:uncharacterized membrane protein